MEEWKKPEIEEIDIAEQTQFEGDPGSDGADPRDLAGGAEGGGAGPSS